MCWNYLLPVCGLSCHPLNIVFHSTKVQFINFFMYDAFNVKLRTWTSSIHWRFLYFFFSVHLQWYSTTVLLQLSKEKLCVTELASGRVEMYVKKRNYISSGFMIQQTNIGSGLKDGFETRHLAFNSRASLHNRLHQTSHFHT